MPYIQDMNVIRPWRNHKLKIERPVTRIVSSRVSHERLAKNPFPGAADDLQRYAQLAPGKSAILISYRGPPVPDSGDIPSTGAVTFYLIEVEEYQDQ
ncbi:hypothetical protein ACFOKI_07680 [Sphingomonas qilianensis]|uniref:Uncharacterized protein n=1 Tax=Sphingomonas qilianensis TaxID=1736690 RepID=A0ABU9XR18_9SPHN